MRKNQISDIKKNIIIPTIQIWVVKFVLKKKIKVKTLITVLIKNVDIKISYVMNVIKCILKHKLKIIIVIYIAHVVKTKLIQVS